jgi:hypothetical protein
MDATGATGAYSGEEDGRDADPDMAVRAAIVRRLS